MTIAIAVEEAWTETNKKLELFWLMLSFGLLCDQHRQQNSIIASLHVRCSCITEQPVYQVTVMSHILKHTFFVFFHRSWLFAEVEPYRTLFDIARWDDLVLNFRMENYRLYQLSTQSLLSMVVQAGLSALKTPQCFSLHNKNPNCPICQPQLNQIAGLLPFSHCTRSRLLCR